MNQLYEIMLLPTACGVFHAGGPRRLSLYQIAQIINRVGGYDPRLLHRHSAARGGPDSASGRQRGDGLRQARSRAGLQSLRSLAAGRALVPTDRDWHYRSPAADDGGSAERLYRALCINPARRSGQPVGPARWRQYCVRCHCPPHATRKRVPDRYGVKEFLKRGKSSANLLTILSWPATLKKHDVRGGHLEANLRETNLGEADVQNNTCCCHGRWLGGRIGR